MASSLVLECRGWLPKGEEMMGYKEASRGGAHATPGSSDFLKEQGVIRVRATG